MSVSVAFAGLTMCLSLIVAIGAQNAFVLRQGIRNEHVFAICLTCAVSDAVLIAIGVTSFRHVSQALPWIEPVMRYGGAAFLLWYSLKSLRSALRSQDALIIEQGAAVSFQQAMITCLAFTWLNPHVYLDSLVLLGTVSTRYPGEELSFAAGASAASLLFFFALGYGAAYLRPLFAKPQAWRVLEGTIAVVMAALGVMLLIG